ncbi:MAG: Nramp family divalent metal transporter [Cyclobacteriaceae bacterium]
MKHLGPSLILTANIVGSGELIMTTTLGAKAGFVTLWVVIFSCLVKAAIQLEFGRHAIHSGETTMRSFSNLPGIKIRGAGWGVWTWLTIKTFQSVQYGGIVGGVALALNIAFPSTPIWIWGAAAALLTIVLTISGSYRVVEKVAIFLVAGFSLFTLYSVVALQSTDYAFVWADIQEGMSFQLPTAALGFALAVFGVTGIGSDEIMSYPYWCLEKGYGKYTGTKETPGFETRAKGWVKVMYLDGLVSLFIYTVTTAAFYLLGASILHEQGRIPEGYEMLSTISNIYTESVGPQAKVIFIVGSVVTLFSTMFVGCASGIRMFSDAFAQIGWLDYNDLGQRKKWFRAMAIILPSIWFVLFVSFKVPVFLILLGAISLSVLMILVVYAAIQFRYSANLPKSLVPTRFYDLMLWLSILATLGVGVKSVVGLF